ncbi:hypothetical protein QR680_017793 [Steinernema hermaphroditum]|uniref:ATPase AAA-type core domain-containing protein n=1 Tax=Steinernema hermaphroditum TaxID=289476 RepID=A0AA39LPY5_9BILA|nr:hypothetical protein QR680_017793 [Steinernema hermaphroditum]
MQCKQKKTKLYNVVIQKYLLFSQLLRLLDAKIQIDPSSANKLVFLQVSQIASHFFSSEFINLSNFVFKKWHQKLIYFGCTPDHAEIYFYSGHLHTNRQFLFEKRRDTVENLQLQLMIQQQLHEQEAIIELELPEIEEEEEQMKNMTIDEACHIVQSIERIYQSKARRRYLQEVRQKAIGLYKSKEALDPNKAIVRIQAITRGYLARKETRRMRDQEHSALGLSTKGLLLSLNSPKTSPKEMKVHVPPEMCAFKMNLSDVLEYLKSNYFIVEKDENDADETLPPNVFSEHTESNFETLVSVGVALCPQIDLFSLVPVKVVVKSTSKSSHSVIFDLRSYMLATVAIPHALSAFENTTLKRNHVLFVGRPKSGRSSWTEALAHFLRATLLRLDKKSFTNKSMGRQKICQKIVQFARDDAYCVVEIRNLELFKSSSHSSKTTTKKTYRSLLSSLMANPFVQVVGLSTSDDIDPAIIKMFTSIVYFGSLDDSERFDVITRTLARRLQSGRLSEPPKRTVKTEKARRGIKARTEMILDHEEHELR